jgi:hypothetical protein
MNTAARERPAALSALLQRHASVGPSNDAATTPSRFRDPITSPDPVLSRQYRSLFARDVGAPQPGQVELLRGALMRGDPLADAWVERVHTMEPVESSRALEAALAHGIDRVPDAPPELVALFRQAETVPLWLDPDSLRLGAEVSRRAGILGHFVLSDFGLMGGYRSAAVAKTLIGTGKLRDGAAERLIHTGRFVTAVTEPGDMLRGRPGYAATLRVRLVHAHVRRALLARPSWDSQVWGVPINQGDTLGTNLLFSIGFLEGCRKWGLSFTEREVEAVIHLWRYVGYLIGVEDALLPSDAESARRALYMVGVSQPDPDQDSVALARALYEVPFTFIRTELARRIVTLEMGIRLSMSRRILGDAAVDQLGLPRSPLRAALPPLVALVGAIDRARRILPYGNYVAYRVGSYVIKKGETILSAELERRNARPADAAVPPATRAPTHAAVTR